MTILAAYAALACVICLALTPVARRIAWSYGCVAGPTPDRWHRRATPMCGGIAIFLSSLLVALAAGIAGELVLPLACGACIFIVGLTDDALRLKPSAKLIAQVAVASILLLSGYRLGWVASPTLDVLLTLVWIVGITNAVNLLDNMDGLCAGISIVVAASLLAGMVPLEGISAKAIYLSILLGATAGFLVYNVHPASIFMGDSGSLFLGLSLATLTLGFTDRISGGASVVSAVAAPVLVMLIPILDSILVTTSRLLGGRRPSQGGRDHSSHRLVAIGLPERTAVAVLWVLAALGGAAAWATLQNQTFSPVGALLIVLAMTLFAVYLGRVKVDEDALSGARPGLLEVDSRAGQQASARPVAT